MGFQINIKNSKFSLFIMSKDQSLDDPQCFSKTEKLYCDTDDLSGHIEFYDSSDQETDQTLKENLNFDIKLGRESSSSSLSWSEEYDNELTKKVYQKLKRLDRVLKRQEEIPSHFDKDEIVQWMHNFPNVSIFDEPHSCDNKLLRFGRTSKNHSEIKDQKRPVIKKSEFTYNRLLTQRSGNTRKRYLEDFSNKNKNIFTISNKSKSTDVLKITRVRKLSERKLSTNCLKEKKCTEFPPEFDSLPFIPMDDVFVDNGKSSSTYRNKKTSRKMADILILPPIQGDKLRSISATPGFDKNSKKFVI